MKFIPGFSPQGMLSPQTVRRVSARWRKREQRTMPTFVLGIICCWADTPFFVS